MNKHSVIYDRASREHQKENWSRDDALRVGAQLAEKHGYTWELRQEIKSGESLVNRPVMLGILRDIEAGKIQAIVCQDLIRLSRDQDGLDGATIRKTCLECGVLVITQSKIYNFENESDDNSADIEFLMGKWQKRASNKQTTRGMTAKAIAGGFLGGKAPFGYKLVYTQVSDTEKPTAALAIDEDCRQAAKEAFELYIELGGRSSAGELNKRGYTKPNGLPFIEQDMRRMIINPLYAGFYTWGRRVKSRWLKDFEAPMHFRQDLQIVPIEIWEKANGVIKQRSHGKTGAWAKHPFSGLLACPYCGGAMYGRLSDGRINYACYIHNKYSTCKGKKYSGNIIARAVIPFVANIIRNQMGLDEKLSQAADQYGKTFSEAELEQRIKAELATIKEAKQRIVKAIAGGVLSDSEAKNELDELRNKEARLNRELATMGEKENIRRDYLEAVEAIKQNEIEPQLWWLLENSPGALRQLIRMIVEPASIELRVTGKSNAAKGEVIGHKFTADFLSLQDGTFYDNRPGDDYRRYYIDISQFFVSVV